MDFKSILFVPIGGYLALMMLQLGMKGLFIGRLSLSYGLYLGFKSGNKVPSKSDPNYFKGFKARFYGSFFLLMGSLFVWGVVADLFSLFGH